MTVNLLGWRSLALELNSSRPSDLLPAHTSSSCWPFWVRVASAPACPKGALFGGLRKRVHSLQAHHFFEAFNAARLHYFGLFRKVAHTIERCCNQLRDVLQWRCCCSNVVLCEPVQRSLTLTAIGLPRIPETQLGAFKAAQILFRLRERPILIELNSCSAKSNSKAISG